MRCARPLSTRCAALRRLTSPERGRRRGLSPRPLCSSACRMARHDAPPANPTSAGVLRSLAARSGQRLVDAGVPTLDERRLLMLRADAIDVVVDVGANEGQYALSLRQAGWSGRIVSYEPQGAVVDTLTARAAGDNAWQVRRLAIGARREPLELKVSQSSMSSSFLPMHATTSASCPARSTWPPRSSTASRSTTSSTSTPARRPRRAEDRRPGLRGARAARGIGEPVEDPVDRDRALP